MVLADRTIETERSSATEAGPRRCVRVGLVDSPTLVSQAFAEVLNAHDGFDLVWALMEVPEVYRRLAISAPDVLLVDVDLGHGALQLVERATAAGVRVVVLTENRSLLLLNHLLRMEVGGLLLKSDALSFVLEGVRRAAAGERVFSERIRADAAHGGDERPLGLTPRQLEVLTHLARGQTAKQVARALNLSVKSVQNHTYRIMRRLDLHDRVELARLAIREGLVAP